MTYRHFYDKDASPILGKAPIQMRVKGGPASSTVQAGVNSALNAFLANARISEAPNLQKTVALPDGTTVRMRSRFGQVIVDVAIPPQIEEPEEKEEFYGGIVIRPYCLTNEAEYLPAAPDSVEAVDFTLPEVTTRERPAVPTLRPGDPTTHIVVQIRNNVPLDNNPVARGYVKIFRIKDPLVGAHAEVSNSPTRYLVSAKYDFSEFYLCGKKLVKVPPLPETVHTIARVQSYGFKPQRFVDAAKATGVLFVAINKKLYGLDAGAAEPAWVLLATAIFDDSLNYANDFGDTASKTTAPSGVTSITCSGSNGAGVCSTFTGIITPGSPRPALSGTITLMHDGTVPEVPGARAYSATLTIEGTNTSGTYMSQDVGMSEFTTTRHDEEIVSPGAMALLPDRFLGGTLPQYTANGRSFVQNWSSVGVFDGWAGTSFPEFHTTYSYDQVDTRVDGTQIDTVEYTAAGASSASAPYSTYTFTHVSPAAIERPPDPVLRFSYRGMDRHTGKMAWRSDVQRSATTSQFPTQTASGNASDPPPVDVGSRTDSFTEAAFAYELLRTGGEVVIRHEGFLGLFGTTPDWAQAYDVVSGGGGLMFAPLDDVLPIAGGLVMSSTPSPPTITTKPFYGVWWMSAVTNYIDSRDGPLVGNPFLPPYPGGASFSYTMTFDASSPTAFNLTDYAAYFAPSFVDFTGSYSGPPEYDILGLEPDETIYVDYGAPSELLADSYLYCPPNDAGGIFYSNGLLFDIRTRGFLAWTEIATEETDGGDWTRAFQAVLGNDVSVVPFRDVLDEWRNLGTPDTASDLKIMFYEAPAEVSLI